MANEQIRVKAILEILGSPKDHVEETMKVVISKAKENFKLLSEKTYETQEIDGLWSTFSEIEISFKNIDEITGFCFNFMPSSVEIMEPINFSFKCNDIANMFNDLLGKLHRYDMVVKNMHAENVILKKKLEQSSAAK